MVPRLVRFLARLKLQITIAMSVSVFLSNLSTALQSSAGQAAQEGGALQSALQQGDISTAQNALASIQSSTKSSSQSQASSPQPDNSQLNQAMEDLQTALLTGNISGAQSAFTALQAAFQQMTGGPASQAVSGGTFSALA